LALAAGLAAWTWGGRRAWFFGHLGCTQCVCGSSGHIGSNSLSCGSGGVLWNSCRWRSQCLRGFGYRFPELVGLWCGPLILGLSCGVFDWIFHVYDPPCLLAMGLAANQRKQTTGIPSCLYGHCHGSIRNPQSGFSVLQWSLPGGLASWMARCIRIVLLFRR
jgi:hypothetical protein